MILTRNFCGLFVCVHDASVLVSLFLRNDYEMLLALDENNRRNGASAENIQQLPVTVVQVCSVQFLRTLHSSDLYLPGTARAGFDIC